MTLEAGQGDKTLALLSTSEDDTTGQRDTSRMMVVSGSANIHADALSALKREKAELLARVTTLEARLQVIKFSWPSQSQCGPMNSAKLGEIKIVHRSDLGFIGFAPHNLIVYHSPRMQGPPWPLWDSHMPSSLGSSMQPSLGRRGLRAAPRPTRPGWWNWTARQPSSPPSGMHCAVTSTPCW